MHASILTLTGVLAALGAAAPAATSQAFEITDLKTCEVDAGNTTIEFTVHDPDPLTDAYAKCTGVWKTGSGGYPSGSYVRSHRWPPAERRKQALISLVQERCGNSTFAWNMAAHKSFFDFTLGIEHTFEDPA